jgi:vacuolar-type H+-ATPase subunit H
MIKLLNSSDERPHKECDIMSLEAIETISAAEENARTKKREAAAAAKKMIADAEEQGKKIVEAARERATSELSEQNRRAQEKTREEALELARNTENRKAAMLVKAESRADRAINIVVERIVSG